MCNCNDNINSTQISSGPQGPTGPQGPPVVISGTSTTNLTVMTGSATFTTQSGIDWELGQRIRATNNDGTKVMEGPITDYTGTSVTINANLVIGSGSNSQWNLVITGERGLPGATGATGPAGSIGSTGINAFSRDILTVQNLGSNLYRLRVFPSVEWMQIGQYIFIENCGYFQVSSLIDADEVVVLDLLYEDNVPPTVGPNGISPAGIKGLDTFIYETVDGNGIPAQGNGPYSILIRNSTDTGYEFITPTAFKAYLATI